MNELTIRQTIALLIKVANSTVQDFFYFPDVILVGKRRIEKEEFHFLLEEGYIIPYKSDSFGQFYKPTKKAEKFIYDTIALKPPHKKKIKIKIAHNQGRFSFA